MILNAFIFVLNISFGWHIPAIGVKPYMIGSGIGSIERIQIDNIQDFLLFEFMFGVVFVISFIIGWAEGIWKKMKAYPKTAALCIVIIIALLIPLVRFLSGDIQGSKLYAAIENGDATKVESILQTYRPSKEDSAYYFFIIDRNYSDRLAAVVPILVAHGFDINAGHPDTGATPLMYQMQFNVPTESIDIMLKYGALPETQDREGQNALHYAVRNEYISEDKESSEYAKFMTNIKRVFAFVPGKEKQLINQPDKNDKTPLMIAKERGLVDAVTLFELYK